MELPQHYHPKEVEAKWQKFWEDNKIYAFDEKSKKPIFSIDTPPPTVSGKMHLGHASSYSQMDFVARYKRMGGYNLFYPFGTDDNGLPTERLVEKLKNVKCMQMERKEFVKLCLKTLEEIRPDFVQDWKKLAISCDYDLFYSTINERCQKISQKSFLDLYKKGREYQKEAPTVFCPACQTAIAQVEMQDKEIEGSFNDIFFKIGTQELIIATTRPELLPACVAIFYHPQDKRYQKLKGKKALVPLFNYEVPILEDERVDPEKGTGLVMCCTFGDQTDVEWYKSYNLPLKQAIDKEGRMTETAGKYQKMKIKEARQAIIKDLKKKALLKSQKPLQHMVNVHERCGTEIEILNSKQWFIRYLDLKEKFLERGREMLWHPEHMRVRYDNWIYGLQWDWCISRQRYFGVPFPLWYCQKCGEVKLAEEKDLPVDPLTDKPQGKCEKCSSQEFFPEKDVLDTWATSSLTPQLAIQLVNQKLQKKLYPMSLRPQAHDIITFWLFNTVVKSHLHFDQIPWENITISGWVLDPHGEKMSKSKGNVVEPQVMLDKYSADALRFWAASSKLGEDNLFQEKELVTGQKTMTKLWNASKFSLLHLEDYNQTRPKKLELLDRWFLSKLNKLIQECTDSFETYEYNKTKLETEKFFWHIFCDYYLELVKDRLYNPEKRGTEARKSAQFALYNSLLAILKLFAPIMPHITEEIYQLYFSSREKSQSIHISNWPLVQKEFIDEEAELSGDLGVDVINSVRKWKSEQKLSLKEEINELVLISSEQGFEEIIKSLEADLKAVLKVKKIIFSGETSLESEKFDIKIGLRCG